MTRTRVHARAYRGSAKVPFPERGSVTDGRTAASLTSCTVRWRAPSSALAWRMRRARSVSSPPTSHRARMRHRVSSHFSRFSEVPSRLGPRSVGLDRTRRRDRARIRTIASFLENRRKSTARRPARARQRAGRSTPRERARDARDDTETIAPRGQPLTDPSPPPRGGVSLVSSRARFPTTASNALETRTLGRVKIHRVSETNRIPITPRASSTSTRPRRAVGNARAFPSSRRSWCSVWTTPLGSTRSSS